MIRIIVALLAVVFGFVNVCSAQEVVQYKGKAYAQFVVDGKIGVSYLVYGLVKGKVAKPRIFWRSADVIVFDLQGHELDKDGDAINHVFPQTRVLITASLIQKVVAPAPIVKHAADLGVTVAELVPSAHIGADPTVSPLVAEALLSDALQDESKDDPKPNLVALVVAFVNTNLSSLFWRMFIPTSIGILVAAVMARRARDEELVDSGWLDELGATEILESTDLPIEPVSYNAVVRNDEQRSA